MRSVNKVVLVGNVTRDPQSKNSTNGQAITTFGIATNRNWTTGDGQKRTSTEFHEVVAWARLAEISQQIVKKGTPVYVEGYLKTRTWETETGVRMRKTEIVIQDLILLEKRSDNDNYEESYEEPEFEIDDSSEESTPEVEQEEVITPAAAETSKEAEKPNFETTSTAGPSNIGIDDDLGL